MISADKILPNFDCILTLVLIDYNEDDDHKNEGKEENDKYSKVKAKNYCENNNTEGIGKDVYNDDDEDNKDDDQDHEEDDD